MVDAAILSDVSKWLAATSVSHTIQTVGWVIPALQTIHILCVAVLFSSAVLVDLRIWRLLQRDVPLLDVGRRFLPLIWPVVLILLVTGSLLIVGEPRRSLLNGTFYIKMALLAFALVLTGLLQWSLSSPGFWDKTIRAASPGDWPRPPRSSPGAALSLPAASLPTRRRDDAAVRRFYFLPRKQQDRGQYFARTICCFPSLNQCMSWPSVWW
jgi:uncharacterized membrane protein